MIDYELTDSLDRTGRNSAGSLSNLARGQQVVDLLNFYNIPKNFYVPGRNPRTVASRTSAVAQNCCVQFCPGN
ncbi:MAG: hypothetical protein R3F38_03565 [Gammaproteobacteria bacterium]